MAASSRAGQAEWPPSTSRLSALDGHQAVALATRLRARPSIVDHRHIAVALRRLTTITMTDHQYTFRFGTQSNDEKSREQNDRFNTMAKAAALVEGGSKAFTPKDLELFEASEEQQRIIFRGATRKQSNAPANPCHIPHCTTAPPAYAMMEC